MTGTGTGFLCTSAKVFKILAWVAVAVQSLVGIILVVGGGPSVPVGGADVPARLVGILNFIAAAVYWFLFTFISHMIKAVIDIHAATTKGSCGSH